MNKKINSNFMAYEQNPWDINYINKPDNTSYLPPATSVAPVASASPVVPTKPVSTITTGGGESSLRKDLKKLDTYTSAQYDIDLAKEREAKATAKTEKPSAVSAAMVDDKKAEEEGAYTAEQLVEMGITDVSKFAKTSSGKFKPTAAGYAQMGLTGVEDSKASELDTATAQATTNYENKIKEVDSWNIDKDPVFAQQVQDIRNQYAQMIDEMKQVNEARKQAYEALGYKSGTTEFAGSTQMGTMGAELSQASKRISDLVAKENAAVSAARLAYQQGKYQEFSMQVDNLEKLRNIKADELNTYNQSLKDALDAQRENDKFELEVLKYQQTLQEKEKPMVVSPGSSIYDPTTGEFLGTAPERPTDPLDNVKEFGGNVFQYDPNTGMMKLLYSKKELEGVDGVEDQSYQSRLAVQGRQAVAGLLTIADSNPEIFGRSAAAPIPLSLRSDAFRNYKAQLDYLKGNIIPAALAAMREASKTGGALGQVSDREGAWLASSLGALEMSQDPETVKTQLKLIDESLQRWENAATGATSGTTNYKTEIENAISTGKVNEQEVNDIIKKLNASGLYYYDSNNPNDNIPEDKRFTEEDVYNYLKKVGKIGFNQEGSASLNAQKSGMRTDRHNNPTAFTTDIAKIAGLQEGVDYIKGDPFSGGKYYTATLLGDPVDTTIKVIDKIGFYTQSGKQRWIHTAMSQSQWNRLSYTEKKKVIQKMYQAEGNQGALTQYFG